MRVAVFLCLLFSSLVSIAQFNYKPGFIINNSDHTTKGSAKEVEETKMYKVFYLLPAKPALGKGSFSNGHQRLCSLLLHFGKVPLSLKLKIVYLAYLTMTRQTIIERTVKIINQLPQEKAEEISDFADFVIKRYEEQVITQNIQEIVSGSEAFDFLNGEEDIYSIEDVKERNND